MVLHSYHEKATGRPFGQRQSMIEPGAGNVNTMPEGRAVCSCELP